MNKIFFLNRIILFVKKLNRILLCEKHQEQNSGILSLLRDESALAYLTLTNNSINIKLLKLLLVNQW